MTARQLIVPLILPLTIILFGSITKWWYVLPVDAPDTLMVGFPLPFVCNGWHTSMSLQIFTGAFIIDFFVYFLICFLLVFFINRYVIKIKMFPVVPKILWGFSIIIITFNIWMVSVAEPIITIKRDWTMKVIATGFKLTWTYQETNTLLKLNADRKLNQ